MKIYLSESLAPEHSSISLPFFKLPQGNFAMHINCPIFLCFSRCLRVICDSWRLFIKFSLVGEVSDLPSQKRRKVIPDSPKFQRNIVQQPSKECHSGLEYGYKLCTTRRSRYKEAKDCLLSLKSSVENLHQKNLFLYNPEVLLKRYCFTVLPFMLPLKFYCLSLCFRNTF